MSKILLSIDPGTVKSGYCITNINKLPTLIKFGNIYNKDLLNIIETKKIDYFAIEIIISMGQRVGKSTFTTCEWIGKFCLQAELLKIKSFRVPRKDITKYLVPPKIKRNDKNVRAAIMSLYPKKGKGKEPQKGTKENPGPLYGVASHVFSALALAIYVINNEINKK
jgi:hypothetical protein